MTSALGRVEAAAGPGWTFRPTAVTQSHKRDHTGSTAACNCRELAGVRVFNDSDCGPQTITGSAQSPPTWPPAAVQELLGHKDVRTTMI